MYYLPPLFLVLVGGEKHGHRNYGTRRCRPHHGRHFDFWRGKTCSHTHIHAGRIDPPSRCCGASDLVERKYKREPGVRCPAFTFRTVYVFQYTRNQNPLMSSSSMVPPCTIRSPILLVIATAKRSSRGTRSTIRPSYSFIETPFPNFIASTLPCIACISSEYRRCESGISMGLAIVVLLFSRPRNLGSQQ